MDRKFKENKSSLIPEKAIDILKTIYSVEFETPYATKKCTQLILKSDEQKELVNVFNPKI